MRSGSLRGSVRWVLLVSGWFSVSKTIIPAERAERTLRHLVISRKISGGTRSEAGRGSKMTLASLFGAWRARGLNPLLETRRLLVSPQL